MRTSPEPEDYRSIYGDRDRQHDSETDAFSPQRLAALGWIRELAQALSVGDEYRGQLVDRLSLDERRRLDEHLAERGLHLVEERGYVYVEALS